jgi:hypothetical protein
MCESDVSHHNLLQTFKRFGVRGASLPVLTVDHMTGILRMDPEAAKSLRLAIDRMLTSCASVEGTELLLAAATTTTSSSVTSAPLQVEPVS